MEELAFVIEDDRDLSAIFAEALQNAGFTTEIIGNGMIAQKRLEESTPRLILLDMHLPYVSGAELLSQIQADERFSRTMIVVATADARLADEYSDIADFVLVKPISFTQLRDLSKRLHSS